MFSHLRRLSSQTIIYGLGDAATRVAALLLLPIYTHILTPADYGKLAYITLFSTISAIILDFGQRTAFFRFYYQTETKEKRKELTGTVMIFLMISTGLIIFSTVFFFDKISQPIVKDRSLVPLIQLSLIGTFFDVSSVIPFATFRAEQHAVQYAVLSVVRFLINTILNIIVVVVLHLGVTGIVYANLITSTILFFVCFGLTIRAMVWRVDSLLLKQLLLYGIPLIPGNLAAWALTLSDRFFLERYTNLSQVGIYSLGYSIAGILNMIIGWFNIAWGPYGFSIANQPDAKMVYKRVLTYSTLLFSFIALGISVFSNEALVILTTPAYYDASRVVPLILLSYVFFEINYLITFGLTLVGKNPYYSFTVVVAAVFNVGLNFFIIPRYGMMGAAVSTALSYMLLPILGYIFVQRFYPIPYELWRLFKLGFAYSAIILLRIYFRTGAFWVDLVIGVVFILAWFILLYFLRFFSWEELSAARAVIINSLRVFQTRLHKVFFKATSV